tara:strand:- start:710 stop:949 length:240 start_codon:yes stop_codon:yes gene_type:complete
MKLEKFTSYRNWIGKTLLWLIGLIMVASQNYGIALKGFLLTDQALEFDSGSYITVTSFGVLFIVSGVYLNRFLDKFTNK